MTLPRSSARAAILIAVLGVGTAAAKDPALSSLTMQHFKDTASVAENQKDGSTVISSEGGYVEHTGPMRMVWHDEFLLGVIDPQTGTRSLQVTAWVIYTGNLRNYASADYRTSKGPVSVPVNPLARQVANCPVGDCTYTERVAFPVDEETLREFAATGASTNTGRWPFKLVAKSGPEYAGELSSAEVAGFLAKIDEYANRPPVPQTGAGMDADVAAANAAAAKSSMSRDFGIGGMSVDASEERPNRAGVLVTGVKAGSVAHKAGIIVGDILYEFDGHPLKTPADLRAALAGRAAPSVAIKLYRGITDTTVSAQF